MLLSQLTNEEQNNFIDLLNRLITVDGEKSKKEEFLFEKVRREIEVSAFYKYSRKSVDTLINYFKGKDVAVRRLVFLNLVSISLNDDLYSVEQHELLQKIQESFEITEKVKKELMHIVYAERDLREKAKRIVRE